MRPGASIRPGTFARVFGWPIVLAMLGSIGLVSALIGDGIWDALSWAALAAPVLVIAWHVTRSAR